MLSFVVIGIAVFSQIAMNDDERQRKELHKSVSELLNLHTIQSLPNFSVVPCRRLPPCCKRLQHPLSLFWRGRGRRGDSYRDSGILVVSGKHQCCCRQMISRITVAPMDLQQKEGHRADIFSGYTDINMGRGSSHLLHVH